MNKVVKFLIIFMCFTFLRLEANEQNKNIVCIHGFMGSKMQMYLFERNFKKQSYNVLNWSYPSRSKTISDHGADLVKELQILAKQSPDQPIYFITHSMGGLVLKAALNHPDCPKQAKNGKAVLIAPPIQKAMAAHILSQFKLARLIFGNFSGGELMNQNNFDYLGDFPKELSILVVAGDFGLHPLLKEAHDGKVAISETKPNCPHEHITIHRGHQGIVLSKKTFFITKDFFNK